MKRIRVPLFSFLSFTLDHRSMANLSDPPYDTEKILSEILDSTQQMAMLWTQFTKYVDESAEDWNKALHHPKNKFNNGKICKITVNLPENAVRLIDFNDKSMVNYVRGSMHSKGMHGVLHIVFINTDGVLHILKEAD